MMAVPKSIWVKQKLCLRKQVRFSWDVPFIFSFWALVGTCGFWWVGTLTNFLLLLFPTISAFWVKRMADIHQILLMYIVNEENGRVKPRDHNLLVTLISWLIYCWLEHSSFIQRIRSVSPKVDNTMVYQVSYNELKVRIIMNPEKFIKELEWLQWKDYNGP